jgi:NADH-ubiquinone oxidoreductase chain 6
MTNLILVYDYLTNGFKFEAVDIIYLFSISFGIYTIISKNPIVSVLSLIVLFVSISGLLILVGLKFIGLSYILVYVGAISILFLFILMLINIRISELTSDINNDIPLATLIIMLFYFIVGQALPVNLLNEKVMNKFTELGIEDVQKFKYINIQDVVYISSTN